jgi:hypothetical protein
MEVREATEYFMDVSICTTSERMPYASLAENNYARRFGPALCTAPG